MGTCERIKDTGQTDSKCRRPVANCHRIDPRLERLASARGAASWAWAMREAPHAPASERRIAAWARTDHVRAAPRQEDIHPEDQIAKGKRPPITTAAFTPPERCPGQRRRITSRRNGRQHLVLRFMPIGSLLRSALRDHARSPKRRYSSFAVVNSWENLHVQDRIRHGRKKQNPASF